MSGTVRAAPLRPGSRRAREAALSPIDPGAFGVAEARHLLLRAGFGGSLDQIRLIADWGPERAVDYLLDPKAADPSFDAMPTGFDAEIMSVPSPDQLRAYRQAAARGDEDALAAIRAMRQERQRQDRRQVREIQRWWITRMIESPASLGEKMTLFWHGHFATSYRTIENSWHMLLQNHLFRAHALGSFAELMHGIIRDPAMLAYLDNTNSRRASPNENLARELMELFSLGVGNYTERDIREGARALTGYTFEGNAFVFDPRRHDSGTKRILGVQGALDGDGFVRAILAQRSCASFIAAKLYAFFVAPLPEGWDDPRRSTAPEARAVVDAMADRLRRERYVVGAVLRELFLSKHFYADEVRGAQIKSPAELVVGTVRQLRTPARDVALLIDAMDRMGQHVFYPPSVAGWSGGRYWINTATLFTRQNAAAYLLTGRVPTGRAAASRVEFDPREVMTWLVRERPEAGTDARAMGEQLLRFMLGRVPSGAAEVLASYIAEHGGAGDAQAVGGAMLLVTAMPEYQAC